MLSEANFIEGLGDEVVIVLGVCLITFIITLAWLSTLVRRERRPLTFLVFQATPRLNQRALNSTASTVPALPSLGTTEQSTSTAAPPTANEEAAVTNEVSSQILSMPNMASNQETPSGEGEISPPTDPPDSLILRLKYLDERERTVRASPGESVGHFKRKHFEQELSENKSVRLIFKGRELKDTSGSCLSHYGLTKDSTIHCLITKKHQNETTSGTGQVTPDSGNLGNTNQTATAAEDMDISGLMFPIFGLLLAVVWYCRISYRQYFNVLSTFALVGITVLFFVAAFTCWTFRVAQRDYLREETPPIRVQYINLDS